MTNREQKIQGLRDTWAALMVQKEELVHQLWTIETKEKQINETLRKYGEKEFQRMVAEATAMVAHCGNDCSTCNDGIRNECEYYKLYNNQ